ncbi:MAG: hypothetical protein AAF962_00895 [Actinomycetota bacterium]
MSFGSRALPRLAAAVVLCLFAAGCGSGDDTSAETTIEETAEETTTTAAPTTTTTEAPTTTESTVDAAAPIPYEGTGGTAGAAGITWTATQCAFPEGEFIGEDSPEHFHSVAVVGTGVFLAGQEGDEAADLLKFQFDGADGCTLTPDATFGSGGVLGFEDGIEYVTASDTGLVMASNEIFGTWLVDAESGESIDCGSGGNRIDLSPDGTVAWDHFPGSNEIDRFDIAEGACTGTPDAVALATQGNPTAGGWIDDGTYIIGGFLEEGAGVTRLDRSGGESWQVGGSALDADTGFGTISAIAPCGGFACVVDSNFREMHILDPADGSQLGLVDLQELVGLDILWFNDLTEADDGALWLVGGLAQELPDGESSEAVQGLVYRIELS